MLSVEFKRFLERIPVVIVDFFTINTAWSLYYFIRVNSGWVPVAYDIEFWLPMIVIYCFWFSVFLFVGMYKPRFALSRFDESILVLKIISLSVLFFFFVFYFDDQGVGSPFYTRFFIGIYWLLMLLIVGGGRIAYRTLQRTLLEHGIGLRNTIIVGTVQKAHELYQQIIQHPALGYKVVGFVSDETLEPRNLSFRRMGDTQHLSNILVEHNINEVLIALSSAEHDKLLEIIASCNGYSVTLKIIPDLYDIVSGQARTNQIYGFPLIEIMPDIMPAWESAAKRVIDIIVSVIVLLLGIPLWVFIAIAIKFDSKGPVLYLQERAGKDRRVFQIVKFRSMYEDAEKHTGPVWASKTDNRITRVGKLIRKLRLDEFPQLLNVIKGDMSLVGPRPERLYFIEQLSKEIPTYTRRLKVRPGITGWAQIKHKYDENIEDVKKKVQYDLFYIENMSLRMDLKILLNTIFVIFSGKGH